MTTPQEQPDGHTKGLIERLEGASEGAAALDREVARLFGWHRVEPRHARNKHGGWIAPEDWIGRHSDGSPILDSLHGTSIYRDPPTFTSSLDAALSLAERERLGPYSMDASIVGRWSWMVINPALLGDIESEPYTSGVGKTAPLALCAAILRAKEQAS